MGFLDKVVGKAKETAADVADKAAPALEKAKVAAGDVAEKAAPVVDKAGEAVTGAYQAADEKAGGRLSGAVDRAKDVVGRGEAEDVPAAEESAPATTAAGDAEAPDGAQSTG